MSQQLQLNLLQDAASVARAEKRRLWKSSLGFLPAWVTLVVALQVCARGLVPAWGESERIDRAEQTLYDRHQEAVDRQAGLHQWLRAQDDPIYLEREKKLLGAPDSPLRQR